MLKRKMLRDIKLNFSQFVTIFLMVFIGIMAYSGIEAYMLGMQETGDRFYKENNLEDLNIYGENFTDKDLNQIKNMQHIKDAERKLIINGKTDTEDTLLLSFIETNNISKIYTLEGDEFNPNSSGVWLDNFYANENNLKVGDKIKIQYDGYTFVEDIKGLINVPDHLYDVKDESEMVPNREKFGFAYLSSNELEGYIKSKVITDMKIDEETYNKLNINYKDNLIFNNIMVDVDEKYNSQEVKEKIEQDIENAISVMKIDDLLSYYMYQGEIDEGKTYVGVFSGLFIFIAMLSVVTTMTRVVKNQREQIGTLKALGFKNWKISLHYISYGMIISIIAAILGLIAGYYLIGNIFMNLEMQFFEIPNGRPMMAKSSYICAIGVVAAVAIVSYIACRKNLIESPANTLRKEIPKVKGKSLNITTKGIFKNMSFNSKWNIRDMLRNKIRTITGIVGIAGCCILIVCAFGMLDSLNNFVKIQYDDIYNFEYKLGLNSNISKEDLEELMKIYGDSTSQSLAIEIIDKQGNKEANNLFVMDAKDKIRFLDNKNNFIDLSNEEGVYITYKLAKTKGYNIGDMIQWKIDGQDEIYKTKIIGFNKDPQNQNMTITRKSFEKIGNTYAPNVLYTNNDLSNVNEINNVDSIQDISELISGINMMLSTMKSMIFLIIFIAIILGIVIIYNMGVLSYTEKQYQFATLKVLGFQDKKIKKIFVKQNNIITTLAVILGLPLGYYLVAWMFKYVVEESFDFTAHIRLTSYLIAALGTYLISFIVSKRLAKKIEKIDMVTSLKANE